MPVLLLLLILWLLLFLLLFWLLLFILLQLTLFSWVLLRHVSVNSLSLETALFLAFVLYGIRLNVVHLGILSFSCHELAYLGTVPNALIIMCIILTKPDIHALLQVSVLAICLFFILGPHGILVSWH